jgi:hypothetical protein
VTVREASSRDDQQPSPYSLTATGKVQRVCTRHPQGLKMDSDLRGDAQRPAETTGPAQMASNKPAGTLSLAPSRLIYPVYTLFR